MCIGSSNGNHLVPVILQQLVLGGVTSETLQVHAREHQHTVNTLDPKIGERGINQGVIVGVADI